MARKFELTEPAKNDLKEIWSYVAGFNSDSADRLLRKLKNKFQMLADNPKIGTPRDNFIVNLRSFPLSNYVVLYFPTESGVEIYRVLHGARNIEDLFENYFEGLKP